MIPLNFLSKSKIIKEKKSPFNSLETNFNQAIIEILSRIPENKKNKISIDIPIDINGKKLIHDLGFNYSIDWDNEEIEYSFNSNLHDLYAKRSDKVTERYFFPEILFTISRSHLNKQGTRDLNNGTKYLKMLGRYLGSYFGVDGSVGFKIYAKIHVKNERFYFFEGFIIAYDDGQGIMLEENDIYFYDGKVFSGSIEDQNEIDLTKIKTIVCANIDFINHHLRIIDTADICEINMGNEMEICSFNYHFLGTDKTKVSVNDLHRFDHNELEIYSAIPDEILETISKICEIEKPVNMKKWFLESEYLQVSLQNGYGDDLPKYISMKSFDVEMVWINVEYDGENHILPIKDGAVLFDFIYYYSKGAVKEWSSDYNKKGVSKKTWGMILNHYSKLEGDKTPENITIKNLRMYYRCQFFDKRASSGAVQASIEPIIQMELEWDDGGDKKEILTIDTSEFDKIFPSVSLRFAEVIRVLTFSSDEKDRMEMEYISKNYESVDRIILPLNDMFFNKFYHGVYIVWNPVYMIYNESFDFDESISYDLNIRFLKYTDDELFKGKERDKNIGLTISNVTSIRGKYMEGIKKKKHSRYGKISEVYLKPEHPHLYIREFNRIVNEYGGLNIFKIKVEEWFSSEKKPEYFLYLYSLNGFDFSIPYKSDEEIKWVIDDEADVKKAAIEKIKSLEPADYDLLFFNPRHVCFPHLEVLNGKWASDTDPFAYYVRYIERKTTNYNLASLIEKIGTRFYIVNIYSELYDTITSKLMKEIPAAELMKIMDDLKVIIKNIRIKFISDALKFIDHNLNKIPFVGIKVSHHLEGEELFYDIEEGEVWKKEIPELIAQNIADVSYAEELKRTVLIFQNKKEDKKIVYEIEKGGDLELNKDIIDLPFKLGSKIEKIISNIDIDDINNNYIRIHGKNESLTIYDKNMIHEIKGEEAKIEIIEYAENIQYKGNIKLKEAEIIKGFPFKTSYEMVILREKMETVLKLTLRKGENEPLSIEDLELIEGLMRELNKEVKILNQENLFELLSSREKDNETINIFFNADVDQSTIINFLVAKWIKIDEPIIQDGIKFTPIGNLFSDKIEQITIELIEDNPKNKKAFEIISNTVFFTDEWKSWLHLTPLHPNLINYSPDTLPESTVQTGDYDNVDIGQYYDLNRNLRANYIRPNKFFTPETTILKIPSVRGLSALSKVGHFKYHDSKFSEGIRELTRTLLASQYLQSTKREGMKIIINGELAFGRFKNILKELTSKLIYIETLEKLSYKKSELNLKWTSILEKALNDKIIRYNSPKDEFIADSWYPPKKLLDKIKDGDINESMKSILAHFIKEEGYPNFVIDKIRSEIDFLGIYPSFIYQMKKYLLYLLVNEEDLKEIVELLTIIEDLRDSFNLGKILEISPAILDSIGKTRDLTLDFIENRVKPLVENIKSKNHVSHLPFLRVFSSNMRLFNQVIEDFRVAITHDFYLPEAREKFINEIIIKTLMIVQSCGDLEYLDSVDMIFDKAGKKEILNVKKGQTFINPFSTYYNWETSVLEDIAYSDTFIASKLDAANRELVKAIHVDIINEMKHIGTMPPYNPRGVDKLTSLIRNYESYHPIDLGLVRYIILFKKNLLLPMILADDTHSKLVRFISKLKSRFFPINFAQELTPSYICFIQDKDTFMLNKIFEEKGSDDDITLKIVDLMKDANLKTSDPRKYASVDDFLDAYYNSQFMFVSDISAEFDHAFLESMYPIHCYGLTNHQLLSSEYLSIFENPSIYLSTIKKNGRSESTLLPKNEVNIVKLYVNFVNDDGELISGDIYLTRGSVYLKNRFGRGRITRVDDYEIRRLDDDKKGSATILRIFETKNAISGMDTVKLILSSVSKDLMDKFDKKRVFDLKITADDITTQIDYDDYKILDELPFTVDEIEADLWQDVEGIIVTLEKGGKEEEWYVNEDTFPDSSFAILLDEPILKFKIIGIKENIFELGQEVKSKDDAKIVKIEIDASRITDSRLKAVSLIFKGGESDIAFILKEGNHGKFSANGFDLTKEDHEILFHVTTSLPEPDFVITQLKIASETDEGSAKEIEQLKKINEIIEKTRKQITLTTSVTLKNTLKRKLLPILKRRDLLIALIKKKKSKSRMSFKYSIGKTYNVKKSGVDIKAKLMAIIKSEISEEVFGEISEEILSVVYPHVLEIETDYDPSLFEAGMEEKEEIPEDKLEAFKELLASKMISLTKLEEENVLSMNIGKNAVTIVTGLKSSDKRVIISAAIKDHLRDSRIKELIRKEKYDLVVDDYLAKNIISHALGIKDRYAEPKFSEIEEIKGYKEPWYYDEDFPIPEELKMEEPKMIGKISRDEDWILEEYPYLKKPIEDLADEDIISKVFFGRPVCFRTDKSRKELYPPLFSLRHGIDELLEDTTKKISDISVTKVAVTFVHEGGIVNVSKAFFEEIFTEITFEEFIERLRTFGGFDYGGSTRQIPRLYALNLPLSEAEKELVHDADTEENHAAKQRVRELMGMLGLGEPPKEIVTEKPFSLDVKEEYERIAESEKIAEAKIGESPREKVNYSDFKRMTSTNTELIEAIFSENPVLFKTSKANKGAYSPTFNLMEKIDSFKYYDYSGKLSISDAKVNEAIKILEERGSIIQINADTFNMFFETGSFTWDGKAINNSAKHLKFGGDLNYNEARNYLRNYEKEYEGSARAKLYVFNLPLYKDEIGTLFVCRDRFIEAFEAIGKFTPEKEKVTTKKLKPKYEGKYMESIVDFDYLLHERGDLEKDIASGKINDIEGLYEFLARKKYHVYHNKKGFAILGKKYPYEIEYIRYHYDDKKAIFLDVATHICYYYTFLMHKFYGIEFIKFSIDTIGDTIIKEIMDKIEASSSMMDLKEIIQISPIVSNFYSETDLTRYLVILSYLYPLSFNIEEIRIYDEFKQKIMESFDEYLTKRSLRNLEELSKKELIDIVSDFVYAIKEEKINSYTEISKFLFEHKINHDVKPNFFILNGDKEELKINFKDFKWKNDYRQLMNVIALIKHQMIKIENLKSEIEYERKMVDELKPDEISMLIEKLESCDDWGAILDELGYSEVIYLHIYDMILSKLIIPSYKKDFVYENLEVGDKEASFEKTKKDIIKKLRGFIKHTGEYKGKGKIVLDRMDYDYLLDLEISLEKYIQKSSDSFSLEKLCEFLDNNNIDYSVYMNEFLTHMTGVRIYDKIIVKGDYHPLVINYDFYPRDAFVSAALLSYHCYELRGNPSRVMLEYADDFVLDNLQEQIKALDTFGADELAEIFIYNNIKALVYLKESGTNLIQHIVVVGSKYFGFSLSSYYDDFSVSVLNDHLDEKIALSKRLSKVEDVVAKTRLNELYIQLSNDYINGKIPSAEMLTDWFDKMNFEAVNEYNKFIIIGLHYPLVLDYEKVGYRSERFNLVSYLIMYVLEYLDVATKRISGETIVSQVIIDMLTFSQLNELKRDIVDALDFIDMIQAIMKHEIIHYVNFSDERVFLIIGCWKYPMVYLPEGRELLKAFDDYKSDILIKLDLLIGHEYIRGEVSPTETTSWDGEYLDKFSMDRLGDVIHDFNKQIKSGKLSKIEELPKFLESWDVTHTLTVRKGIDPTSPARIVSIFIGGEILALDLDFNKIDYDFYYVEALIRDLILCILNKYKHRVITVMLEEKPVYEIVSLLKDISEKYLGEKSEKINIMIGIIRDSYGIKAHHIQEKVIVLIGDKHPLVYHYDKDTSFETIKKTFISEIEKIFAELYPVEYEEYKIRDSDVKAEDARFLEDLSIDQLLDIVNGLDAIGNIEKLRTFLTYAKILFTIEPSEYKKENHELEILGREWAIELDIDPDLPFFETTNVLKDHISKIIDSKSSKLVSLDELSEERLNTFVENLETLSNQDELFHLFGLNSINYSISYETPRLKKLNFKMKDGTFIFISITFPSSGDPIPIKDTIKLIIAEIEKFWEKTSEEEDMGDESDLEKLDLPKINKHFEILIDTSKHKKGSEVVLDKTQISFKKISKEPFSDWVDEDDYIYTSQQNLILNMLEDISEEFAHLGTFFVTLESGEYVIKMKIPKGVNLADMEKILLKIEESFKKIEEEYENAE